jgi:hypothetical protein
MEKIRAYYAALAPLTPPFFEADDSIAGNKGMRYTRWSYLFRDGQHGHRGQLGAGRGGRSGGVTSPMRGGSVSEAMHAVSRRRI